MVKVGWVVDLSISGGSTGGRLILSRPLWIWRLYTHLAVSAFTSQRRSGRKKRRSWAPRTGPASVPEAQGPSTIYMLEKEGDSRWNPYSWGNKSIPINTMIKKKVVKELLSPVIALRLWRSSWRFDYGCSHLLFWDRNMDMSGAWRWRH